MIDKKDIEEYLGYEIQDGYTVDYRADSLVDVDIKVVKKHSIGTITCTTTIQKSGSYFNDTEH